jgi:FAD-linked sulfhydryl oxidase
MDPEVWGPHYWMFLHTVAANYPIKPTALERKVHYRLIHNFHEFLPHRRIAAEFVDLLKANPVTPYLDTRDDFVRWMHHLHNEINRKLDKPKLSLENHKREFNHMYSSAAEKHKRFLTNSFWVVWVTFLIMIGLLIYMYQ